MEVTGLTVTYFSSTELPSKSANSLHVMKMCAGLAHIAKKVVLVNFSNTKKPARTQLLFNFYSIQTVFDIKTASNIHPSTSLRFLLSTFLESFSTWFHLRSSKPDLVLGRYLPPIFYSAILGYPVVFETHYPVWESRLYSLIFKWLIRNGNLKNIVVITEALKAEYLAKYPFLRPELFVVLPDAADPVQPSKLKRVHLQGAGSGAHGLDIGYTGSLYQGKGLEIILALARLLPGDRFHVFGGEQPLIDYWQKSAKIAEIHNLFFYGFVAQEALDNFIHAFDICLLPNQETMYGAPTKSRTEKNLAPFTSPMKLFQYMAHGKAIISSDIPALREVVDESLALFAPPQDPIAWQENIELLRDSTLRERLGRSARNRQQELYTWNRRAVKLLTSVIHPQAHQTPK